MPINTDRTIIRLVDADDLTRTLSSHGAFRLVLGGVTVDRIRELAQEYREDNETDGRALADELDALADAAEVRPVHVWDRPRPSRAHADLFHTWEARLRERSPLLEPLADDLSTLWSAKDPGVYHARRALDVLTDANKILPGVDEALRHPLSEYAGA